MSVSTSGTDDAFRGLSRGPVSPRRLPKLPDMASRAHGPSSTAQQQSGTLPSVRVENVLNKALSLQSMSATDSPAATMGVRSAEVPLPALPPASPSTASRRSDAPSKARSSDSKAAAHVHVPVDSPAFDASIGATRVEDEPSLSLDADRPSLTKPRPPVQLIEGGQWRYYLFFVIKALLIAGTIGMVVVNCALGPPDSERQKTPSQDISVAGQTCQINPEIDSWWVILVGMGAAQFLWAAGASVRYAVTGWFPRNSSEVYLLQLPVSTISLVSAGAGLAGGGYLLLMLSWFVVSLMSGFAVVSGLLTGVPGLFDKPADKPVRGKALAGSKGGSTKTVGVPHGSIVRARTHSSEESVGSPKSRRVQPKSVGAAGENDDEFEGINPRHTAPPGGHAGEDGGMGESVRTDTRFARDARISAAQADAQGSGDEVDNPYSVTVQQYGRFYTALLLLYEFNKISDIATALILGVGDPLRVSFFVLGTLSLVHVQVTFYWLVGTRDGDTTVIDLYRGFGDVVLDTPMLCIEFYAIVTGIITETNFTVFVISLVLKSLSTLSHVFTLYKDIKLFMESRSRENFRRMGSKLKSTLAKTRSTKSMRRLGGGSRTDTTSSFRSLSGSGTDDNSRVDSNSLALYNSSSARKRPHKPHKRSVEAAQGKVSLPSEPVALSAPAKGIVRAPV